MVKIPDLSNVEAVDYGGGLVTAGWHVFQIDDAQDDVSGNGNPMFILQLQVAAKDDPDNGMSMRHWMTITPKTMPGIKHQLQCLGVTIPDGDFELNGRQLVGRKFKGLIRHEPYVKDGEQRMGAKVMSWAPLSTTPPSDAGNWPGAVTGGIDDDIPF